MRVSVRGGRVRVKVKVWVRVKDAHVEGHDSEPAWTRVWIVGRVRVRVRVRLRVRVRVRVRVRIYVMFRTTFRALGFRR